MDPIIIPDSSSDDDNLSSRNCLSENYDGWIMCLENNCMLKIPLLEFDSHLRSHSITDGELVEEFGALASQHIRSDLNIAEISVIDVTSIETKFTRSHFPTNEEKLTIQPKYIKSQTIHGHDQNYSRSPAYNMNPFTNDMSIHKNYCFEDDSLFAHQLQEQEDMLYTKDQNDYQIALTLQSMETKQNDTFNTKSDEFKVDPLNNNKDSKIGNQYFSNFTLKPNIHNQNQNMNSKQTSTFATQKTSSAPWKTGNNIVSISDYQYNNNNNNNNNNSYKRKSYGYINSSGTFPAYTQGYESQYVKHLERLVNSGKITSSEYYTKKLDLMENISLGEDNLITCTNGVIQAFRDYLSSSYSVWCYYLSCETPHFSYSPGDTGWGCGYRNLQMLVGAMCSSSEYKTIVNNHFNSKIPTVTKLQTILETAWKNGYDKEGAKQLGYYVNNTKTWIGATDVVALLRSLGLKAEVIDFSKPQTIHSNSNDELIKCVERYFRNGYPLPITSSSGEGMHSNVITNALTNQLPLYLQHEGHSRTIVGCGQLRSNKYIFLLDPMHKPYKMREVMKNKSNSFLSTLARTRDHFNKEQYQLVFINGVIDKSKSNDYKVISPLKYYDNAI